MKKQLSYRLSPKLEQVLTLLSENDLLTEDITIAKLQHFIGVYHHERLVGVGGVEFFGENSLLRSLAVNAEYQGMGIGSKLLERIEQYARSLHVNRLYLLTHTAETLFLGTGYFTVKRMDAPSEIACSSQFESLCPADSSLMVKSLAA